MKSQTKFANEIWFIFLRFASFFFIFNGLE